MTGLSRAAWSLAEAPEMAVEAIYTSPAAWHGCCAHTNNCCQGSSPINRCLYESFPDWFLPQLTPHVTTVANSFPCCLIMVFLQLQVAQVGQGTFGKVIRAAHTGPQSFPDVAIKLLPRGDAVNTLTLVKHTPTVACTPAAGHMLQAAVSIVCIHSHSTHHTLFLA